MSYHISVAAAVDLEDIWSYSFEHWSQEQADRYVNLIFDEIDFLSENPDSGKDFSRIRKGYRSSKVKSHIIFYRKSEGLNGIEIVRILHQQMDIENRLEK